MVRLVPARALEQRLPQLRKIALLGDRRPGLALGLGFLAHSVEKLRPLIVVQQAERRLEGDVRQRVDDALELMGLPYRIVISDKTLAEDAAELTNRFTGESQMIKLTDLANF